MPPGAKLVGYNMQLIAGYIPTTFFNNRSQKDDKRLESRDPEITPDIYSKYRPGYNMNITKNYEINENSNEMNAVTTEGNMLKDETDNELKNESLFQTNFAHRESSFLESQKESTDTDAAANITDGFINLSGFLWPVVETELKGKKQKEENTSAVESDTDHTSVFPIEHNLSALPESTRSTTTAEIDSQGTMDRLNDEPFSIFPFTVTTASTEQILAVDERDNLGNSPLAILQNTNSLMKRYNDEMINLTSILEIAQSEDALGEEMQEIPFFQQLQTNYTDGQAITEPSGTEISPTRSWPVIIPKTKLDQQNNIGENRSTTDAIIQISESNEREIGVENIEELFDIHVTTPVSLQNLTSIEDSNVATVPQTIMMDVDSSEIDNEEGNKDKAEQNHDDLSRENPEEFSKMQLPDEQRNEMSKKLNFEQNSRNIAGVDDQKEESFEREMNDDDKQQDKSTEMKSSSEETNNRSREDNYDEKSDDSNDNDYNNDDYVNSNDSDNIKDDDDDDNLKMSKENDDEILQSRENSEENQGRVNAPIFSPEQIPTFEEWLSSLPIQHAFPFSGKNQSPANPIHLPFPTLLSNRNRKRGSKQRPTTDSEKKQKAPMYDYSDSDDEDKSQFHEKRFTLSKNVPYD